MYKKDFLSYILFFLAIAFFPLSNLQANDDGLGASRTTTVVVSKNVRQTAKIHHRKHEWIIEKYFPNYLRISKNLAGLTFTQTTSKRDAEISRLDDQTSLITFLKKVDRRNQLFAELQKLNKPKKLTQKKLPFVVRNDDNDGF